MSSDTTDIELLGALSAAGLTRSLRPLKEVQMEQLDAPEKLFSRIDEIESKRGGAAQGTLFAVLPKFDAHAEPASLRLPLPLKERMPDVLRVVEAAYREVRGRSSTDMVLIDPVLNSEFLHRCQNLGTTATAFELNTAMLYGRKLKKFGALERAERFTIPDTRLNEFMYASEMSLRHIREWQVREFGRKVSLDTVLCDPDLVAVFDDIARRLAPGEYSTLEYRWAALRLRKSNRALDVLPRLRAEDLEDCGRTEDVRLEKVPRAGGVYCFRDNGKPIYFGQADSLRRQIERHIETGGFGIVPEWLARVTYRDVRLEMVPMPGLSQTRREAVKSLQVANMLPAFNWLRQFPLFAA